MTWTSPRTSIVTFPQASTSLQTCYAPIKSSSFSKAAVRRLDEVLKPELAQIEGVGEMSVYYPCSCLHGVHAINTRQCRLLYYYSNLIDTSGADRITAQPTPLTKEQLLCIIGTLLTKLGEVDKAIELGYKE